MGRISTFPFPEDAGDQCTPRYDSAGISSVGVAAESSKRHFEPIYAAFFAESSFMSD